MVAKLKVSHQQDIKNRKKLGDIVPLDTPLSMQIELASACNFKCGYCLHSSKRLNESGFRSGIMDYFIFEKIVNQIEKFPQKLEFISLQSRGESLLNKRLPDMIRYIKEKNIAKEIAINTNAVFLTHETSLKIVDAGLDSIRISIQGINAKQYKEVAKVDIDFDELVNNIQFLYNNKRNLRMYIKIINAELTEEDKSTFLEIFSPMCDTIFIENPIDVWVDTNLDMKFSNSRYGYTSHKVTVCPRIFFAMVVHFDGTVVACDIDWEESFILGNINNTELVEIWNSDLFNKIRVDHLKGEGKNRRICSKCTILNNCEMDDIDSEAIAILARFNDTKINL